MEADELFDIHTVVSVPLALPSDPEGKIFLLGNARRLARPAEAAAWTIAAGMYSSPIGRDFRIEILEISPREVGALGYNIICPIMNPLHDRVEYVVARAAGDSLTAALWALLGEAGRILKEACKELLILDAFGHPAEFRKAVRKVFDNPESEYPLLNCMSCAQPPEPKPKSNIFSKLGNLADEIVSAAADFFGDATDDVVCDIKSDSGDDACIRPVSPQKAAEEAGLERLSARERKELLLAIPAKITASFEKQDPATTRFVNEVTDNLSLEELRAIIKEMYAHHSGLAQKITYQKTAGVSKYELIIRRRDERKTGYYRNKLWYIMYLRDAKGREIPLVFKNAPAYCIYVMHVIDRYRCKENTRALDILSLRDEFIRVYETLFEAERPKIEHFFDELANRSADKDRKSTRTGRYNDYLADINRTLESRLGSINSMPFKIGTNQFLPLLPSRIQLPPTLAELKIS